MTMPLGSLPSPELAPSPPRLVVTTTAPVDVLITVTIAEVIPVTHSSEPSGVSASTSGPPDTGKVLVTLSELVLMTETSLELMLATYSVPPLADSASPHGICPTGMVAVTCANPAVLITSTTPRSVFVTYTVLPSGETTTPCGSPRLPMRLTRRSVAVL